MSDDQSKFQENLNWYLSLLVLVLFAIVPPILCGLLYLSRVPDVSWERVDKLTYDRIWLYRERRPVGIGYQAQRIVTQYRQTEVCVENRLRFLLWGKSEEARPATSRQIMAFVNNRWQPTGEACR